MSKETRKWLIDNVRVGYVGQDGPAWWATENHMTDGSHFDGPVPMEEVQRILNVPLVKGDMQVTYTGTDGESHLATNSQEFSPIVRADTGHMFKVFSEGYQIHAYQEWLLGKVARVLDTNAGDLTAKSVGLLKNGAQAWLQIRLADTFEINGFGYVPFLTAATSANGSLASQFGVGVDAAVCDNTLTNALLNAMARTKIKHTMHSNDKDQMIRDALGLLFTVKDGFDAAATELMNTPVTDADWEKWLDLTVPVPEVKEGARGTRGVTMATNKRDALNDLWTSDPKVQPWSGTAFGVVQADNTWRTWSGQVRGADGGRMERYFGNMIDGTTEAGDTKALKALSAILDKDLLKV